MILYRNLLSLKLHHTTKSQKAKWNFATYEENGIFSCMGFYINVL